MDKDEEMYISKIYLKNFRNYEEQEISLEKGINIFYGDNAQGKTNIIEAVFLCSYGKSFRSNKDKELIRFNEEHTSVKIDFEKEDRNGFIKAEIGEKKNFFIKKCHNYLVNSKNSRTFAPA